jgi:hydrogenase maturation protease
VTRAVVIGLGNLLRGDDGAGIAVARRVRAAAPSWVEVVEVGDDLAGLLDAWAGMELAIVVDAIRSGEAPGKVRWIDLAPTRLPGPARSPTSSHALGLAGAVELARTLDRLPGRLVLIGIQAADTAAGEPLSPAVAAGVEVAATQILRAVADPGR